MNRPRQAVRHVLIAWVLILVPVGTAWGQQPPRAQPARKARPRPIKVKPAPSRPDQPTPTPQPEPGLDRCARLLAAETLSRQGRHLQVLDLLAGVPAAGQHWEYGFLRSRAAGMSMREYLSISDLGGRILALDFSPNGALMAASGTSGGLSIFDTASGALLKAWPGHRLWVRCLQFHPSGKLLATGGDDGFVRIWHVEVGLEIRHLPKQYQGIRDLCFSPDGKTLATACLDGMVKLWNVGDAEQLNVSFGRHDHGAGAVAYSPDGEKLASMSLAGEIFLWDVSTGEQLNLLGDRRQLEEACIAFSPDGSLLACGYRGSAAVWELRTGQKILHLDSASTGISRVAFTSDGRGLFTARDHTVCLWEVATGRLLTRMTGRAGPAYALSVQGDGSRFAVGGRGEVHLFTTPSGDPHHLIGQTGSRPSCLRFADDDAVLLAGAPNGTFAWELETNTQVLGDRPPGRVLGFSRDGTLVAAFGPARELTVRRWDTGELMMKIGLLQKAPLTAVFTNDNSQVFTSEWSKNILLYDLSRRRKVWSSPALPQPAVSLAISLKGKHLAAATRERYVAIYDLKTGKMCHQIDVPATAVAFGKDGALALAGQDRTIRLFKPWSQPARVLLHGHHDHISNLAFTPDGQRLASAAADGTVRLWAPDAGIELMALQLGPDWLTAVAFSADGRHLAASDQHGGVHLWESDRVWSVQDARWVSVEEVLASAKPPAKPEPQDRPGGKKPSPPIIRK